MSTVFRILLVYQTHWLLMLAIMVIMGLRSAIPTLVARFLMLDSFFLSFRLVTCLMGEVVMECPIFRISEGVAQPVFRLSGLSQRLVRLVTLGSTLEVVAAQPYSLTVK